jgi:hypothetical protein
METFHSRHACSRIPKSTSSASSRPARLPRRDRLHWGHLGTQAVGYFWSKVRGWPLVWDQDQETAIPSARGGTKITWGGQPIPAKLGKNRLHLDLVPPAGGDQQAEVDRLVSLGATRIDIGQGEIDWAVLADPDGNEFRVIAPC